MMFIMQKDKEVAPPLYNDKEVVPPLKDGVLVHDPPAASEGTTSTTMRRQGQPTSARQSLL